MEMLVDSFLSYFGYELDFKTFFGGAIKLWHSPQVSCWPRFFCSILNHVLSTIFQSYIFFFFKFCQPSCGTHLKWVAGQDFFSQVLLAKLWHLPQVSCWPRFFSQVLSAKLWHSPRVAGQDFFVQFWIMSIQQYFSHKNFLKFFFFFQFLIVSFSTIFQS